MTIILSPALEARLRDAAAHAGVTVEQYVAAGVERAADAATADPESRGQAAADCGIVQSENSGAVDPLELEYDSVPVPATPSGAFDYWRRVDALGVFTGRGDAVEIARQLRDEEAIKREPDYTDPPEILDYWKRTGVFESAPAGLDGPELARHWRKSADDERRSRLFGDR
ncbi:MAG: hypothetical protein LC772_09060 [Chloroflexi bacterium]|nr:hypothetical protein [Chloroflexota bacterium]